MRGKLIITISLFVVVFCASNICAQYVHPFDTFTRFENPNLDNEPQNAYDLNLLKITIPKVNQIELSLFLTSHGIFGGTKSERQFIYQNLGLKDGNIEEILDFRLSIPEEQMSLRKADFASENLEQYPTFSSMNSLDERNNSFIMYPEINNLSYLLDKFFELQRNTNYDNKFSFSLPSDSLKNNSSAFASHYLDQTRKMESDHVSYLLENYNKKKVRENPSIHQSKDSNHGTNHLADLDLSSAPYPDFSFSIQNPGFVYDVFDTNSFSSVIEESSDNSSVNSKSRLSNRQRRVAFVDGSTYTWEIKSFSNPNYDEFTFEGNGSLSLYIKPVSSVDSGNHGTSSTGTLAFSSVYNQDSPASPKLTFLTSTNTYTISSIDQSLWRYVHQDWAGETNWSWGVEQSGSGPNYNYYLSYNTNGFTLSVVPEPSTYFMTGALFCLIGYNRQSRKALKHLFSNFFPPPKEKVNCKDIKNQLS